MKSFSKSSDTLIELENLSLLVRSNVHFNLTLRDEFIEAIKSPFTWLGRKKEYVSILNSITFNVQSGDRLALIGRNGAGKTSLCRILAGMYRPSSGRVRRHAKVRSVFDSNIGLYPELTGRENAMIIGSLLFSQFPNWKARIEEALEFTELEHKLDFAYKHYSAGMQTRLGLSILSAFPAEVLILDEVFDGADVFFRAKLVQRIESLIRDSGAVIFVSHSEEQIKKVANKAVLLDGGKVIGSGSVIEIYDQYVGAR